MGKMTETAATVWLIGKFGSGCLSLLVLAFVLMLAYAGSN